MEASVQGSSTVVLQQNSIHTTIADEIQEGGIEIPQKEAPLIVKKPEKNMKLIDKIVKMKNKTLQNLHQLQNQERQLLQKMRKTRSPLGKSPQRSYYTEQEKESIKIILKSKKKRQQVMKQKHDSIIGSYLQKIYEQREREAESIEKQRKKHQQLAAIHLKKLKGKQQQRSEVIKKSDDYLKEVRKKKYLFQVNKETIDQPMKIKEELMREEKLKKIKQEHQFSAAELEEHAEKHRRILKEKEIERKEKIKTQNSYHFKKHQQTKLSRVLQIQDQEKRSFERERKLYPYMMRDKVKQFQSNVRKYHRPSSIVKEAKTEQKSRAKALSYQDSVKQGNQYLKYARKLRKQKQQTRMSTEPKVERYENYLLDLKKNNKKFGTVQRFRTIMDSERSVKDYSTAAKATQLAEEIYRRSKKNSDDKMYESIRNKLDILSHLI